MRGARELSSVVRARTLVDWDWIVVPFGIAPRVGLEPTTLRLTAECSTIELSRIILRISPPRCLRTLKTTYRKYITSNPIRQHLRTPQFSMAPDCSALRAPAILTKIRKSHRSFHSRCFFAHLRFRVLCLYTSAHASMLICVHP